jgi:eukaryotic-like serine/threonine-protein kinase
METTRAVKLVLNDEWILGGPIGSGGFGTVHEAKNAAGVKAAVKLVRKAPGTEREMLFTDLEGVHNVVPIIDRGEHEDQWVLVMPLAEKSLRAHLQQNGPLPLREAVSVLCDVAETLADLKDRGIVHRDLKPENILFLGGRWCLADFGIARYAEATTAKLTFKFTGTFAYMAPERWNNQRATSASDIYALGILAHELLEGSIPFAGPADVDFAEQHLRGTPPPLTTAPLLAALVAECLFKGPQGRPAPGNLLERLRHVPVGATSGGLAALAEANQSAVARKAEADRRASEQATEADRRNDLFEAAKTSFGFIADDFLTTLKNAAPSAEIRIGSQGGWTIRINDAQLTLSGPQETAPEIWHTDSRSAPFDVIASATLSLRIPANYQGYEGRSHSLWYADAQTADQYQWFETAFMSTAIRPVTGTMDPFTLNPHHESRGAVNPGMAMHQVAWPFTPLVIGNLDEFISRWAAWLASAANGHLSHPSTMPERSPEGSWRR